MKKLFYRTYSVIAQFLTVLTLFVSSFEASAQGQGANTPKMDRLFDNLMRRGELPLEFKVGIYRTGTMGPGPYLGTIVVRNSMITIGGREEAALILKPNLLNLTPGPHAFHIHENPDCGPGEKDGVMIPGLAAGGHLYAEQKVGDVMVMSKSHLGNLPNLMVAADGTSSEAVIAPRLTLADLVNRSIMIHASQADDSSREACGIFR